MLNLPTPSSLVANKLIYITLGDARNDGVKRLYFAQFYAGTKVYESVFVNNAWRTTEMVSVGEGRNDSKSRVYSAKHLFL